jgi:heat shock protein HtpX
MRRFNNPLKTVLLLGALSALLVGFGSLFGPGATWMFLGVTLAMNLGAYFFSDRLVLRMHGARPVEEGEMPPLRALSRDLAHRAGLPTPRLRPRDAHERAA